MCFSVPRRPARRGLGSLAQKRFHIVAWNQATSRDLDSGELSLAHQFVERAASDAVSGCGIIDAKRAALDWSDGGVSRFSHLKLSEFGCIVPDMAHVARPR